MAPKPTKTKPTNVADELKEKLKKKHDDSDEENLNVRDCLLYMLTTGILDPESDITEEIQAVPLGNAVSEANSTIATAQAVIDTIASKRLAWQTQQQNKKLYQDLLLAMSPGMTLDDKIRSSGEAALEALKKRGVPVSMDQKSKVLELANASQGARPNSVDLSRQETEQKKIITIAGAKIWNANNMFKLYRVKPSMLDKSGKKVPAKTRLGDTARLYDQEKDALFNGIYDVASQQAAFKSQYLDPVSTMVGGDTAIAMELFTRYIMKDLTNEKVKDNYPQGMKIGSKTVPQKVLFRVGELGAAVTAVFRKVINETVSDVLSGRYSPGKNEMANSLFAAASTMNAAKNIPVDPKKEYSVDPDDKEKLRMKGRAQVEQLKALMEQAEEISRGGESVPGQLEKLLRIIDVDLGQMSLLTKNTNAAGMDGGKIMKSLSAFVQKRQDVTETAKTNNITVAGYAPDAEPKSDLEEASTADTVTLEELRRKLAEAQEEIERLQCAGPGAPVSDGSVEELKQKLREAREQLKTFGSSTNSAVVHELQKSLTDARAECTRLQAAASRPAAASEGDLTRSLRAERAANNELRRMLSQLGASLGPTTDMAATTAMYEDAMRRGMQFKAGRWYTGNQLATEEDWKSIFRSSSAVLRI